MKQLGLIILVLVLLPVMVSARTVSTIWKDRDLSYEVQYQLDNDPVLKAQQQYINIATASYADTILLVGEISTKALKQRASLVANNVPGVRMVYNQLLIASPISPGTRTYDTWLTSKVKTALLFASGVPSTEIKIVTENRVVYLLGKVSRQQGNLAAQAASKVSGIKKIIKIFNYTD